MTGIEVSVFIGDLRRAANPYYEQFDAAERSYRFKNKAGELMGLGVCSVTVRAVAGGRSQFPQAIDDLLCKAVSAVSIEELQTLMGKHESDPANFDGRIEKIIRSMQPNLTLHANHRVFEGAKFNNDLILETDDALVCVEIEKSPMARFEFDILKMPTTSGL